MTINLTDNNVINVTLTCGADGALCYQWESKNGLIPSNSTAMNVSTLVLINVQPEDAGDYRCVAINENGHNLSNNVTVTINGMKHKSV